MKHHLLKRGYKNGCIQDGINKASSVTREEALANKRNQKILKRVPFVITYNPMLPNIPKILNESHTILHASERCAEVFQEVPLVATGELEIFVTCLSANDWHHIHLQRLCLPQITEIPKTAPATSQIKPDSPTKAPHPAPTSVRNVASYSRIRRVSKSIKPPSTSGNKTYQPPLDSGLATLTPDVRPVNQGCSIPPSAAQIMAVNTSSNNL